MDELPGPEERGVSTSFLPSRAFLSNRLVLVVPAGTKGEIALRPRK